jgi:hypothetical protein
LAVDFFPLPPLAPFAAGEGDFSAEAGEGCVTAVLDGESDELLPHPATSAATTNMTTALLMSLYEIN